MVLAIGAQAYGATLKPELSGLSFLLGRWSNGRGAIAETGGSAAGASTIEAVANGGALLRRDHTDLFDAAGRPAGGFDQVMTIYPEAGGVRGDYFDGDHVIHYVSAVVVPGRSVTFSSAATPGAPVFHLTYQLEAPARLKVSFGMTPPGSEVFRPIAEGVLERGE